MSVKPEYYVAFSIAGTHTFITANKRTEDAKKSGKKITLDGFEFTIGQSRTHSERDATKLLSKQLEEGGRPSSNARNIHAFFIKLRDAGWDVDDKAFVKKHGLTPVETPVVTVEPPKAPQGGDFHAETPPAVNPVAAKMASASVFMNDVYTKPNEDHPAQSEPDLSQAITEETLDLKKTDDKSPDAMTQRNTVGLERLDGSIHAVQGDITKIEADAIINAANAQLIPGGGVDGAINRAAGPELETAMRAIGGCPTGGADITDAFGLQTAKHIIHAVGPIYQDYDPVESARLLRSAYDSAFELARVSDCGTVAAPLLSTGVYGYPMDQACAIAVSAAKDFNTKDGQAPLGITFVAFDDAAYAILMNEIAKLHG